MRGAGRSRGRRWGVLIRLVLGWLLNRIRRIGLRFGGARRGIGLGPPCRGFGTICSGLRALGGGFAGGSLLGLGGVVAGAAAARPASCQHCRRDYPEWDRTPWICAQSL